MRRPAAAAGSAAFFALAPGTVAGLLPWMLTGWRVGTAPPWPLRAMGAVLILAGLAVLVPAFVRFVVEGVGTPAPVAPTGRLVVGGPYRYVRNPMYLAVLLVVVGQAVVLGRPVLWIYAAVAAVTMSGFVTLYEEPHLARTYGAEYDEYRATVPGWWPRWRRSAAD